MGVAGDVRYQRLTEDAQHMVYVPFTQGPGLPLTLLTRTKMDLNSTSRLIARELEAIDARLLLENQGNLLGLVRLSFYPQRRLMGAAGTVSALAVVIASVGLYAALLFLVSQQTREIGIRMALGADRGKVLALILRGAVWQLGLGLLVGVPVTLAGGRALAGMLYGVKSYDPWVFGASLTLVMAPFVGSFLGVVTDRVEIPRAILWGRSACPHCRGVLAPRDLVPVVSWALSRGFTAMKVKVGIEPDADVARVRAVRDAIGDEIKLGVDANGGWKTVSVAVATIRRISSRSN